MKLTKLQLDTISNTLYDRLRSHYTKRRNEAEAGMKVPAEVKKLIKDLYVAEAAVKAYNNREQKGLHYVINNSSYSGISATLSGFEGVYLPNGSVTVDPDDAQEARDKADAVGFYLLSLTLGNESLEGMESFLKNLLK